MIHPNLKEEKKLWRKCYRRVAGIDEAGVGPLAGPVVAASVIIKFKRNSARDKPAQSARSCVLCGIINDARDSKKLTPKQRKYFYNLIISNKNIKYSVSSVSAKVIDKIGIRRATELAMERCIQKLKPKPDFIIIDGNRLKPKTLNSIPYTLIVKADEKVISCALASIIAKVTRDKIMIRMAKKYPKYAFEKHKGYGTKHHFQMLKKYGSCEIHRKTYAPVKKSK